jgi:predicted nucleic acid-binding protein
MTVVVDTNVLVRMMGRGAPYAALKYALEQGRLRWALSTAVLLEYEEIIGRLLGAATWSRLLRQIEVISLLWGTILRVSPSFRFRTIAADADDDAFADCAIAAELDHHRRSSLRCATGRRIQTAADHS